MALRAVLALSALRISQANMLDVIEPADILWA